MNVYTAIFYGINEIGSSAMEKVRQLAGRLRGRMAYPAIAVAMGISTLVAGSERTSFLASATGQTSVATSTPLVPEVEVAQLAKFVAREVQPPVTVAANPLDSGINHPRINRWVERLTTSLKGDFKQSLDRMGRYDEMILAKLDARQMPRQLIYLAMIESNFNPTAKSRVSAVGLWQFMSGTARQFGLKVGGGRDDRKDPAKATDAALSYLSALHKRFGSWYLAAAAYNSGEGTVSRALKRVTGRTQGTDADFFRILSSLPRETQDYVPKLIASARVGSDPAKYGMN
jgi:membrane-bound lytic murein transglycosylase D